MTLMDPYYVSVIPGSRWSNDGLDRFISFGLLNYLTGQVSIYRAWVSAGEIARADYRPVTFDDTNYILPSGKPRLEYVGQWTNNNGVSYWWGHDGSRLYYVDPRDTTKIRVKIVGVGVTMDDDQILYHATFGFAELSVGPAVDPMNPDRYLVATATPMGTGIIALDLATQKSWWLATGTGNTFGNSIGGPRGPCFSPVQPDGSLFIAFGNNRYDKTNTPYFGVYRVPFIGGQITRVTEIPGSKKTGGYVRVNDWSAP